MSKRPSPTSSAPPSKRRVSNSDVFNSRVATLLAKALAEPELPVKCLPSELIDYKCKVTRALKSESGESYKKRIAAAETRYDTDAHHKLIRAAIIDLVSFIRTSRNPELTDRLNVWSYLS